MALTNSRKRTSAITAALLLLVLAALAYNFLARPMLQAMGATTYGPLSSHRSDIVLDDGERLLAALPPLDDLSDNSLRIVAMPSFGPRWIAASLSENGAQVTGRVVVFDRKTGNASTRAFVMPKSKFDELTHRWDDLTDSYWGELRGWTDGTPLGFERKRGGKITSGLGNSPCHYDALGNLAAIYIGPQAHEFLDLRVPDLEQISKTARC